MKRISLITIILLLTLSACVAQNQSVTLQHDSIPAATIVPALQTAAGVRDTITESIPTQSRMTRTERRTKRAEDYAFKIDSLIATRAFAFYPTLMQAVPGGEIRQVYADYFYIYISPVDLEVHLPTEYGMAQQMSMLNFDTEHIGDYTAVKYLTQWSISFLAKDDGVEYSFSLDVSTITGRSVLNIVCPNGTMRYVGSIGEHLREKR